MVICGCALTPPQFSPLKSHVGDVTTETNATKSRLEALLETGVAEPAHQWKLLVSNEVASMKESLEQQETDLESSEQLLSSFLLKDLKEDLPTGSCYMSVKLIRQRTVVGRLGFAIGQFSANATFLSASLTSVNRNTISIDVHASAMGRA